MYIRLHAIVEIDVGRACREVSPRSGTRRLPLTAYIASSIRSIGPGNRPGGITFFSFSFVSSKSDSLADQFVTDFSGSTCSWEYRFRSPTVRSVKIFGKLIPRGLFKLTKTTLSPYLTSRQRGIFVWINLWPEAKLCHSRSLLLPSYESSRSFVEKWHAITVYLESWLIHNYSIRRLNSLDRDTFATGESKLSDRPRMSFATDECFAKV